MKNKALPIILGVGAVTLGACLLLKKDYFKFENWHPAFDTVSISKSEEKTPSGKKSIQIENIATGSSATYGSILIEESEEYGTKALNANWSKYKMLSFYFYTPSPISIQVSLGDIVGGTTQANVVWSVNLVEGWNYVEIPLDYPTGINYSANPDYFWNKEDIKRMRITIQTNDTDMINYIGDFRLIKGESQIPILIDDFELGDTIKYWQISGNNILERSSEEVSQGNYSAKFTLLDPTLASMRRLYAPTGYLDMTPYNNIHIDIWSSMNSKFHILFTSQNSETEGSDYYVYNSELMQGWNSFDLTKEDFGISRTPLGWDKIGSAEIHWDWGGIPEEIVGSYYYIDNFIVS